MKKKIVYVMIHCDHVLQQNELYTITMSPVQANAVIIISKLVIAFSL